MNDSPRDLSEASVRTPSRFHLIWLVPIVAAGLAIYLGWKTLSSEGPLISVTFHSGQGLTAGQTKVMHKAVAIGIVESVQLSADFQQVVARVRMDQKTTALLTDHARSGSFSPIFPQPISPVCKLYCLVSTSTWIPVRPAANQSASSLAWSNLRSQPISLAKPSRCRDPTWAGCSQVLPFGRR